MLCPAYAMTDAFRGEIIDAVREDFIREGGLSIAYYKATRGKTMAG